MIFSSKGKTLDDDALNDLGSEIRNAIDKLGKQMVEAGILHEDTYQKNLGKYLAQIVYQSMNSIKNRW